MTSEQLMDIFRKADSIRDRDPGDNGGTITALSYRWFDWNFCGNPYDPVAVVIEAGNRGFRGKDAGPVILGYLENDAPVVYRNYASGIVTGEVWLQEAGLFDAFKEGENVS